MKRNIFRVLSLVLSVFLVFSIIPIGAFTASADSANMLVWDNVRMYSRLHYRPDTGNFEAGAKYMYSFDFHNMTDNIDDNLWQIYYRNAEEESKDTFIQIPYSALSITKSDLANGYHYDVVFTVPDDCYPTDNIMFKFGDVTSSGYVQNMKMGNLDLWKLNANDEKETQIELSLPDSISSIAIVRTDNPVKYYGYVGRWTGIYNYLTDISLEDQDGYFEPETVNPFAAPENTLRIYKGGTNTYAEYVDNSVNLAAGEYVFGCKYKTFGTAPDFAIYTS
ncbi:MAG: hypothetical protein J5852_00250, partial [Clostridia bacterium]|nr:hypothetical protein [Clostridia bacterium]